MNDDEIQKVWQSQGQGPQLALDTDLVLNEVRRNQRQFRAMLFWRDTREIGVAACLTCLFAYWANRDREWALYLLAFACLGVGLFMLADRWLQNKKQPVANDSLRSCVEASLSQVNHQIWLLKNVFWWYLLPVNAGIAVFIGSLTVRVFHAGLAPMLVLSACSLVCALVCWGVYRLNQHAVKQELDPRREELEALLAHLSEDRLSGV